MNARTRGLLAALAVVALVAAATVVALTRGPVAAEPGTPEAAVQEFAEAVLAGDLDAALALVAEPRTERLRCAPRPGLRITLGDVTTSGDTARVAVTISEEGGDPLPGQAYTWEDTFQLERDGGDWRLVTWPWALCEPLPAKVAP